MSDGHTGPPRDLPPCPRARVTGYNGRWRWEHWCPHRGHMVASGGYRHWELAYRDAEQHMNHCEVT